MHPRALPPTLASRCFTATEAYAAGVGRGALRGPAVHRLHTGVYVPGAFALDLRAEVAAARLVLPAATLVTGVTALWGFGVEVGVPRPMQFVTTHPHQVRRPGLSVARTRRLPPRRGDSVTPEHAFASAAKRLDLVELVSAGDWLVRRKWTTPGRLNAYARAAYRGAGAARARRAAAMVRERVDSLRETKLRLCVVLSGLPEPQCNITLGAADHPIGRVDLLLEEFRVILEYEGDQHRIDKRQWNVDISRVEEFSTAGYRVLRVTADHLHQPRVLVRRVHAALVAGGYQGPEPVFTREWCELFE